MLKVQKFCLENKNWEEILSSAPYFLDVKKEDGYVLFLYNLIKGSDLSNEIVQECRGLILKENTFRPVCVPFYKFFNYGEANAAQIDWTTATVEEKAGGSIIKVWYDNGEWKISTNGTINAYNASICGLFVSEYENYGNLFLSTCKKQGIEFSTLPINATHIFEIVSPFQHVVNYKENVVYYLGSRNNVTLREYKTECDGAILPRVFPLNSLEACIKASEAMEWREEEGYVVKDANYNRIKIKSPKHIEAAYRKESILNSERAIIETILKGEESEFLSYFPEYTVFFNKWIDKLEDFEKQIVDTFDKYKHIENRKEFAKAVENEELKSFLFLMKKGTPTAKDVVMNLRPRQILDRFSQKRGNL